MINLKFSAMKFNSVHEIYDTMYFLWDTIIRAYSECWISTTNRIRKKKYKIFALFIGKSLKITSFGNKWFYCAPV